MKEIDEAIALVENGDIANGLARLEKAQAVADDDGKYQIAELFYEWGHVDKAIKIADELLERYPDEHELAFFLAELFIDSDQEERAIEVLTNVRSQDADHLRALLLLADIYCSEGLDEVAEQKLLEAKRMAPDEPIVTFALGEFYFMLGDFKKSVSLYEKVLEDGGIPGENVDLRLAESLSGSGEFEKALPYYQKAAGGHIESDGLFHFGFTAYQAGEYQQAIRSFNELEERDPDYGKLYLYLAKAYRAEGALQEAFDTAVKGLTVNEFSDVLAYEAGDIALAEGRMKEAEQFLNKALQINPLHHDALKLLAGLFSRQERYDEVVGLLNAIEDIEEQDPVFSWYLATARRGQEDFDEAAKHYEQANRGFSEDPVFLDEYGDFLIEEGRRTEAVSMFKKALSADPSLIHLEDKIAHFEQS